MKRAILLTLVLAISISLASASFALYSKTLLEVAEAPFSAKIFDVSFKTEPIVDTENITYSPSWIFMAFNSASEEENNSMFTEVTLLSATVLPGTLTVELSYPDRRGVTQTSKTETFNSVTRTAKIDVQKVFANDATGVEKRCVLQFSYDGSPISLNATNFSVNVWMENLNNP